MTLEEVIAFLNKDEKGKEWLEGQKEEAKEKLATKNSELIEANKRFKKEKETAESKVTELEEELSEAGNKDQDVQKQIDKAVAKVTKERDEAVSAKDEAYGRINKLVVDNGLNDALAKANIAKQHLPAVRALLREQHKIEVDDTDNTAKVGDKSLTDFITEWSQGDIGKNYVAAQNNSGGGAQGGKPSSEGGQDPSKIANPVERLKAARRQQGAK